MPQKVSEGVCGKNQADNEEVWRMRGCGNPNFSDLFKRIVNRFSRAVYTLDNKRQAGSLVFNPITVEGYAAHFSCTAVVQASDSMTASM